MFLTWAENLAGGGTHTGRTPCSPGGGYCEALLSRRILVIINLDRGGLRRGLLLRLGGLEEVGN